MLYLPTGSFFGQTNRTISLDGITITDTEYTHPEVDWHYHENAYFTFLLAGRMIEGNKKGKINCDAGTLLFHNWEESHYNAKPRGYTRGFQVEIKRSWFDKMGLDDKSIEGSFQILDPDIKLLFHQLYKESKISDLNSEISLQTILLKSFSGMLQVQEQKESSLPSWVNRAKELLHDNRTAKITLEQMAAELNIHPVHLSRDFPRYFHSNLGDYIRKIKIEYAMTLMQNPEFTFSDIAFECNFADQSHFIRTFRSVMHTTPLQYRKAILY